MGLHLSAADVERLEAASRVLLSGALRERYGLTRREAEVALLLAEGLTNAQLARRLFVSESTARTHAERVPGKLGLRSRKALALRLLRGDEPDGASRARVGQPGRRDRR